MSVTWKIPEKDIIHSLWMKEFSEKCDKNDFILNINSPSEPWRFNQDDLDEVKERVYNLAKMTKKSNKDYYVELISNYTLNTSCNLKYN